MGITRLYSSKGRLRVVATLRNAMVDGALRLRRRLVCSLGLEAIVIGLGMVAPYTLKVLVDGLAQQGINFAWGAALVIIFIVGSLGGGILTACRRVFSQRIIDTLNEEIVDDVLKVAMPKLAGPREGDSGRIQGLIERLPFGLQVLIEGLIWQIAPIAIQVVLSLVIIAGLLKPLYVLVLAITLAGYILSTWYGAVRQRAVSQDVSAASSQVSETVSDILRNARRVVLNGALPAERRLFRNQFSDRAAAFRGMLTCQVQTGVLQYGIAGLGLACLLILSVSDVLDGRMTIGDFVLLQAYAFRLVLPLSGFGFVISQAALALSTVRETLELGREEAGQVLSADGPPSNVGAAVILRDVAYSYGLGLPGLHNISFTLRPGSFNVIVGPNGSGKSTLAQLMAGILEPVAGEVLVDGIPLTSVPPSDRYRYLLYVPQTITLLNRSLLANALYPPTLQTEAELTRLLTEWRFYDPARQIDFNRGVGEQGERLSGGQRQKLELARIARVRVPVIILDESTSALDPVSEADIIRTLREGYGAATTLVLITHRTGLAEMADQVLFMKNGTLLRTGKHEALMRDSAAYVRLWEGVRGASKGAGPNPKV